MAFSDTVKTWGIYIGTVAAGLTLAATVVAGLDYMEVRPIIKKEFKTQVFETEKVFDSKQAEIDKLYKIAGDISKSILTLQFYDMQDQLVAGKPLSFEEQQKYCNLAKQLDWTAPGCGFLPPVAPAIDVPIPIKPLPN
jgi:hypothetical protein